MASLKEVRTRISSTESTQQITKAMKLVAATKLKKATDAIAKMRPYSEKMNSILGNLASAASEEDRVKKYFEYREVKKALVVVLSSDRGLCGGFNASVIKATRQLINEYYKPKGVDVEVTFLGKKAHDILKKEVSNTSTDNMGVFSDLSAENVFAVAQQFIDAHAAEKYDEVRLVYNQFKNAATQIIQVEKMLPVQVESVEDDAQKNIDYIFEPGQGEILVDLVPKAVKTQLYKACLDSFASETGARMVAMDAATENAGEMLDKLRLQYNQARQAAITGEILEIVSGAAALEG